MKNLILTCLLLAFLVPAFALNPSITYKFLPEKYNMTYTQLTISVSDGEMEGITDEDAEDLKIKLAAWHFTSPKSKVNKLVIISHNGEGNMADYLRRVDQFLRLGCDVVTYDYRGYGHSAPFQIEESMYIYPEFISDLDAVVSYCRDNFSKDIVLYGWGIGAGLSLGYGYHEDNITEIIADAPFLTLDEVEYRSKRLTTIAPYMVPKFGFDIMYQPQHALHDEPGEDLKGIKLMIGLPYNLVNLDDMKTLQEKQPKLFDKEIYSPRIDTDGKNLDLFMQDKETYFNVIADFLDI